MLRKVRALLAKAEADLLAGRTHWQQQKRVEELADVDAAMLLDDLPRSPKYFWVYTAHKSMGITVTD